MSERVDPPCDVCGAPSTCFCVSFKACGVCRCDAHRDNTDSCSTAGHGWVTWAELDAYEPNDLSEASR